LELDCRIRPVRVPYSAHDGIPPEPNPEDRRTYGACTRHTERCNAERSAA
jgi:hypothetical protein